MENAAKFMLNFGILLADPCCVILELAVTF